IRRSLGLHKPRRRATPAPRAFRVDGRASLCFIERRCVQEWTPTPSSIILVPARRLRSAPHVTMITRRTRAEWLLGALVASGATAPAAAQAMGRSPSRALDGLGVELGSGAHPALPRCPSEGSSVFVTERFSRAQGFELSHSGRPQRFVVPPAIYFVGRTMKDT